MAVPGSVVGVGKLITPGGQQGPKGDAGTAANVPLADITQNGLLRKTSGNTTDFTDGTNNYQPLAAAVQPTIWSARLRSFNAVGNPNFEVDQRNIHGGITNPANNAALLDRYFFTKTGTMTVNAVDPILSNANIIPGTSFAITSSQLGLSLQTQEASLAAGDYLGIVHTVEGPNWRELSQDVTSLSLLVYSTVAPLKFSVALRDSPATKSLVKLCTIPTASTWTLITLPNIPVPPSGNFSLAPGAVGYSLQVTLACGATFTAPSADVWNSGNFIAAPGADNWASKAVGSTFYVCFIQHEPGPVCSTLIDRPFAQNLDECLRYFQKSYNYGTAVGAASSGVGTVQLTSQASQSPVSYIPFPKRMAKVPSVTLYSTITGAINTVRDTSAGVDRAVTAVQAVGEAGYGGASLSAYNAAVTIYQWHYIADTGW